MRIAQLGETDQLVLRGVSAEVRDVLDATAGRRDYALLVPEDLSAVVGAPPARVFRAARRRIAALDGVAIRIRTPEDPALRYGAKLLAAAWRDLGLDVRLAPAGAPAQGELVRRRGVAPGAIPIAHAVAAFVAR